MVPRVQHVWPAVCSFADRDRSEARHGHSSGTHKMTSPASTLQFWFRPGPQLNSHSCLVRQVDPCARLTQQNVCRTSTSLCTMLSGACPCQQWHTDKAMTHARAVLLLARVPLSLSVSAHVTHWCATTRLCWPRHHHTRPSSFTQLPVYMTSYCMLMQLFSSSCNMKAPQ